MGAVTLAMLLRTEARVVTFEPSPANLRCLTLDWCVHLHTLPDGIGTLHELREMRMRGC